MEKNNIKISNKMEIFLKLIISYSALVLTMVLSNRFPLSYVAIGAILSFVIMLIIMRKVNIKSINKISIILSIFISSYMMKDFLKFSEERIIRLTGYLMRITKIYLYEYLNMIVGIMALPALVFFVYFFIGKIFPKVKKFLLSLTNVEKRYVYIMFFVGVFLTIMISFFTTAFTKPYLNGDLKVYDVIYTTDTGALAYNDTFFNISYVENDIRQPLFGVCALPFAVLARGLSEFAFFLPQEFAYEMIMIILQFIITTITTIMIARLLNLEEKDKKYLYLLFSFSFPYLLFNLVLEQYVIGLFYLITTIYIFYNYDVVNYLYVGTVGSLIVSGIIFPCISKFKNMKQYTKDILKCFFAFLAVFIISGQLPQLFTIQERLNHFSKYNGNVDIIDKLFQFLNFVQIIFVSAAGHITKSTYQLCVVKNVSIVGIVMLSVMLVSAIINRKNSIARLSFLWVIFSNVILFVFGWGTVENGLVLYTLYFSWAYLILYYLFLKKILSNRKIFIIILLVSVLIMAIFNIRELLNIISFAVRYY